jgi:Ca-activated chloride channel homolog
MNLPLAMKATNGSDLLLEKVAIRGSIHATLATVTMRQEYRNDSDSNVEAIYTFPLPPEAVLLRTTVELKGKRYEGTVLPRTRAEQAYEGAIEKGDTAIMVERPEPGFYTMNVGNLMAGESAAVEIEFAQLLDWSHGRLRFALPMTIAPRYAEERGELQPHARPPVDILTERPFSLELAIAVQGSVSSPSHSIATGARDGELLVTLTRLTAWMDKDFVLLVQASAKPEPFAMVGECAGVRVGYVSFQIPEAQEDASGRDVRIVVDCSGSMGGESIALARRGVINLLHRLRNVDRFSIVAFGSTSRKFRSRVVEATEDNVEDAIAWAQGLNADMGGTELASALEASMAFRAARRRVDIFLVTDGQVGQSAGTVARARQLGHRIFVVGIGVSPSRGLLEELVETTGGAIDNIAPSEDVADAIGRQFARATQYPLSGLSVDWGVDVLSEWCAGTTGDRAFSGDTVHAFCDVSHAPRSVQVKYQIDDSAPVALEVPCQLTPGELSGNVLHRIAADRLIREGLRSGAMDTAAAEKMAIEHQLVTKLTNYVLAIDRGEARANSMPETKPIRHMLAAGWGATSAVAAIGMEYLSADLEAPAFTRREPSANYRHASTEDLRRESFASELNHQFGSLLSTGVLPLSVDPIISMGLSDSIGALLAALVAEGHSEEDVMRAFWAAFALFLDPTRTQRGLARKLKVIGASADQALVKRILAELDLMEVTP